MNLWISLLALSLSLVLQSPASRVEPLSIPGDTSEEASCSLAIRLSPNPNHGTFTLQWQAEENHQDARVKVYDLRGNLVDAYSWPDWESTLEVFLQGHPAGQYLVEVIVGPQTWMSRVQVLA